MNQYISTDNLQFRVLAPASSDVPLSFRNQRVDPRTHDDLIFGAQIVRGLALRENGQMGSQLLSDGRHFQQVDSESWHVLLQNGDGCILGCARYRELRGNAEQFGACHSPLARSHRYGPVLKSALERLVTNVRMRNKQYGEAGGWVLRREIRGSTAAINIALMTFALAEHLGSGGGITTATRMHHSAAMLCRIGARRVPELPAYYEPRYGSVIELLHFDLPYINPRYRAKLEKIRAEILLTPVICACASKNDHADLPAPQNPVMTLREVSPTVQ